MKYTKFLSVYDVLISLLPSVSSTLGVVPYFESPWIPLLIGAIILVIVLAVIFESNMKKKENALAEIIATGYFINFLEPLTKMSRASTIPHPGPRVFPTLFRS